MNPDGDDAKYEPRFCGDCGIKITNTADHDCPVRWRKRQESWYHRLEARRLAADNILAEQDEISTTDISARMAREWYDFLDTLEEQQ